MSFEERTSSPGEVDLSRFSPNGFDRGAPAWKEALWLMIRPILFHWLPGRWYGLRRAVLRAFGASVGQGVVIKPGVCVSHPWRLTVGDYAWIGENCWIQTLAPVVLEDHVVLSQNTMLVTGNHDYTSEQFDLRVAPIRVGRGAWLTAGSVAGPGVTVGSHAVLGLASVTSRDLEAFGIYRGNPAERVGTRRIQSPDGA